jgi:cytochrome b
MTTSSNTTSGTEANNTAAPQAEQVLVWDLWVRVTHWLLVLTVAGAWATRKLPGDWFQLHTWLGYSTFVLVVTRLAWGFVGTRHARFSQFVRGPGAIWRYVTGLLAGRVVPTAGHNPLGALSVLVLLGLLLGQASTGLFSSDADVFEYGPLAGYVATETSRAVTGWHEEIAEIMLVFIGLHVLVVLAHLVVKRENLIRPMFTGRKSADQVPAGEGIAGSRLWLALIIVVLLGVALAMAVRSAPLAEPSYLF